MQDFWLARRIRREAGGPNQAFHAVLIHFEAGSAITVLSQAVFREAASGRERSGEHLEHLLGGDHHQSEGEMRGDLDRAMHTDMPSVSFMKAWAASYTTPSP